MDAVTLAEALDAGRVARAFLLAWRDAAMRSRFAELRAEGRTVEEAVGSLLGPYVDERGGPYYLSEERVRAIVYRK